MSISEKISIGYILKVDFEYSDELHNSHNDYPLAPGKLAVFYKMLLDYCKEIADKYRVRVGDAKNLIPNLGNKTKYVLHYKDLQLYLSLRMKLTKIHRVLKFKQSDWMKKYIDFNTEKRKNAANDFEKDFFKLMINSVYGKTMENLRKRINVRLINNAEDFFKFSSQPSYITLKTFGKDYAVIHEIKQVLILNKPIYVGFTVLELSKWLMYDFYYNFIKKNFDAELLFTDTGSLTDEIKSKDVYEGFFKHKHLFGFSNYPKDSKFFDEANKKVIGKMKDESDGKIIDEFVRLKSKMHSIKNIDSEEFNTAEEVNIEFNEFKSILFNKKRMRHKMKRIQAKNHKIGTYKIKKMSLSRYDDKRFVLIDGIDTLAYFHKDFKKQILTNKKSKNILTDKKDFHKKEILTNDHKQGEILMMIINNQRFSQIQISAYK